MAHARQQVRDAVKTRLAAIPGLTVVENIAATLTEDLLPAAIVSTASEESTAPGADLDGPGNISLRGMTLVITIVADGAIGEDEIDALAVQIETALNGDLGGLVRFSAPVAEMSYTLDRQVDEEGQRWFTFADFEFSFQVATVFGDPETIL